MPEVEEDVREGHESEDELARLYHVILLDDDDHTYEYVVEMLCEVFSFTEEKAYDHTVDVDHGCIQKILRAIPSGSGNRGK